MWSDSTEMRAEAKRRLDDLFWSAMSVALGIIIASGIGYALLGMLGLVLLLSSAFV